MSDQLNERNILVRTVIGIPVSYHAMPESKRGCTELYRNRKTPEFASLCRRDRKL